MAQSAANETRNCFIFIMLERGARGRRTQSAPYVFRVALLCLLPLLPRGRRGPRPGRDPLNTLNTYERPSPSGWLVPVPTAERFGSSTVVKVPVEPNVTWSHWMVPASANPKPRAAVPRPPARSPQVVRSRGNGNELRLRWRWL